MAVSIQFSQGCRSPLHIIELMGQGITKAWNNRTVYLGSILEPRFKWWAMVGLHAFSCQDGTSRISDMSSRIATTVRCFGRRTWMHHSVKSISFYRQPAQSEFELQGLISNKWSHQRWLVWQTIVDFSVQKACFCVSNLIKLWSWSILTLFLFGRFRENTQYCDRKMTSYPSLRPHRGHIDAAIRVHRYKDTWTSNEEHNRLSLRDVYQQVTRVGQKSIFLADLPIWVSVLHIKVDKVPGRLAKLI